VVIATPAQKNLFWNCCEIRLGVTIVTTEQARLASRYPLPRCRWRNDPPGHRFLDGGEQLLKRVAAPLPLRLTRFAIAENAVLMASSWLILRTQYQHGETEARRA